MSVKVSTQATFGPNAPAEPESVNQEAIGLQAQAARGLAERSERTNVYALSSGLLLNQMIKALQSTPWEEI